MLNKKGFTLIELLVVIAIIGLLSTLAVVSLNNARVKSRDAKRVADIKSIQTALELHYVDNEDYPTMAASTRIGTGNYNAISSAGFASSCGANTCYMGNVPEDPTTPASGTACASGSTAACAYAYQGTGTPTDSEYEIWFWLEEDTGELLATENCATETGISSAACVH